MKIPFFVSEMMPVSLQSFNSTAVKHSLFGENQNLLVAVSGGVDSMVLLHLLHAGNYRFAVAHCNFGLRGEESEGDEDFVRNEAEKLGLKYYVKKFDTGIYGREKGISTQMAARELRYSWFDELVTAENMDYLLTAHHADDQVETQLLNMARGTGLKGLVGIEMKSGRKIRPLLNYTKEEIKAFAAEKGIAFREDASNASVKYQRNRIRHEAIPALKEVNSQVYAHFALLGELAGEAEKLVLERVGELKKKEVSENGNIRLNKGLLQNNAPKLITYEYLKQYGLEAFAFQILTALDEQPGALFYGRDYRLLVDRNDIIISTGKAKDEDTIPVNTGFWYRDEEYRIEITEDTTITKDPARAYLDADKITFPLELRIWKEGDKFQPLGMKGKMLLSDFFINQKINRFEKENSKVLCSAGEIVWIPGMRISEKHKVTDKTRRVVRIWRNEGINNEGMKE